MHQILETIINFVGEMGYIGIFVMMTIESSFVPFPSEIAMFPAGYLSAIGEMNIVYAFLAGTAGALLGASINYFGGMYLGKPLVSRLVQDYGKYILLNQHHYEKSEAYFQKHGAITTLLGRFIPGVRQLISIPAGIFRMNYLTFIVFTAIGAGTWNAILLFIGYAAGKNEALLKEMLISAKIYLIIGVIVVIAGYVYYNKKVRK